MMAMSSSQRGSTLVKSTICSNKHPNPKDEIMVFSTGFAVVRPDNSWTKNSIGEFIVADYFVENVVANSVGVSYPAINASDLGCLKIIHPSKIEQSHINKFLEGKVSKINSSISSLNTQISRLGENSQSSYCKRSQKASIQMFQ